MSSLDTRVPSRSISPGAGTNPIGVSTASPRPLTRWNTHSRTLELSPKPGQSQRPPASFRNQLT